MTVKLRNNVVSSLRTELLSSSTTVILPVGHGVRFPSLGAGEYFYATIEDAAGNSEIVQATARATDTLTVVRGAEGTTPRTFAAGSTVEMRVTAASVLDAASDAADAVDLTTFGVTASAAELNILDGVTASTAEINVLDGITATTAELNILDGVTASTAELNILDGVTASTAEINILDGVTASAAELNQLDNNTFTGDITIQDKIVHAGDTNTSLRFPAADTVSIETGGAERLRVTSDGNVSVGTTSTFYSAANRTTLSINGVNQSMVAFGAGGSQKGYMYTDGTSIVFGADAGSMTFTVTAAEPMTFNTNNTERLRISATGNVTASGDVAVSGNVTANGLSTELRPLELGTAVASTSGTSIDFTGIPSWAKRVTVMFNGVSLSSTASLLLVRLGTSGGLQTSGYVSNSGLSTATNGLCIQTGAAAANTLYGHLLLTRISGNTWVSSHTANGGNSGSGGVTLSGTLDRLSILNNASNNFDAGSINIMWE